MQKTRLGISVGLMGAALYLTAFFGMITDLTDMVVDLFGIARLSLSTLLSPFTSFMSFIYDIVNFIEKLLFFALGVTALFQGNIPVPVVDNLIRNHMA